MPPSSVRPEPPVRLDQALVPQVGALGGAYETWVHRSIKPQGSLRMFRSDFLERLSHIRWWVIPLVWVPIVLGLWAASLMWQQVPAPHVALAAVGGLCAWTLLEYALHRFVFHHRFRSAFGRRLHFVMHGIHHLDPWDPTRLVFPPLAGVLVAAPIFGAIWLVVPLGTALAAMGGVLSGYLVYDMTHFHVHHRKCRTRWGKFLKAWHLEHHHKRPQALYGVSSPLWDLVFRTGRPTS